MNPNHDNNLLIIAILIKSDKHVGSKTLLKRLEVLKVLKLHVYGHIHESYGVYYDENQQFISCNASSLDYYKPVLNEVVVFTLNPL